MRRSIRQGVGWVLGAALLLAAPVAVSAAEETAPQCPICGGRARTTGATYGSKASTTLARGAANTLLGWTEMIRQPAEEVKAGGNVFVGMLKGLTGSVKRTAAGVGEVLTFWTPQINHTYLHFADDCPVCARRRAATASH